METTIQEPFPFTPPASWQHTAVETFSCPDFPVDVYAEPGRAEGLTTFLRDYYSFNLAPGLPRELMASSAYRYRFGDSAPKVVRVCCTVIVDFGLSDFMATRVNIDSDKLGDVYRVAAALCLSFPQRFFAHSIHDQIMTGMDFRFDSSCPVDLSNLDDGHVPHIGSFLARIDT